MQPIRRKPIKGSYRVCFSPNGAFLASTARDVGLWSSPEIKKLWRSHPLPHPGYPAFSPDSSLLAVKSSSGRVVLLSTASGTVYSDFQNNSDGEGGNCLFSADGSQLVDSSWRGAHVVRSLDGKTLFREEFYPDMVVGILRHPSGRLWFRHQRRTAHSDNTVPRQRLLGRDLPFAPNVYEQVVIPFSNYTDAAFSPDGSSLAILAGHKPQVLSVFSFPAMEALRTTELPPELRLVYRVRYSPCGRLLGVVGADLFLALSAADLSVQLKGAIPHGCDIDFSPTDSLVALGAGSAGEVLTIDDVLSRNA